MKKGFTLIELLATICIIGIAVIIVLPMILPKESGNDIESTLRYEYVDADGNYGKAKYCKIDSILYCELEDGTMRGVVQFKEIK